MALIIVEDLEPKPKEVSLPEPITFTVKLRDDEAPADPTPANPLGTHRLLLRLEEDNDLSFSAGRRLKQIEFEEKIPKTARKFTFPTEVHGEGAGLVSFQVSLDVPGTSGTACLVDLL
ncbi:MAG: hypothetical protein WBC51_26515 [Vicinamibacterales bacterium]